MRRETRVRTGREAQEQETSDKKRETETRPSFFERASAPVLLHPSARSLKGGFWCWWAGSATIHAAAARSNHPSGVPKTKEKNYTIK